jgi:hypothetical protein
MHGRVVSLVAVVMTALPALVLAGQTPSALPGVTPLTKAVESSPAIVPAPAPGPAPVTTLSLEAPITLPAPAIPAPVILAPVIPGPAIPEAIISAPVASVAIDTPAMTPTDPMAPLAKAEFNLPPGLIPSDATPRVPILPPLLEPRPAVQTLPQAPPAKLTPAQIAREIAPNFNVERDYVRLTQCYGTADFMGAVTRIQASRPGATAQVLGVARSIGALQDAMQPMVLAASTVRTEARFRRDYDAIARRGQNELATSRTPNVTMQRRLATLDACRADVSRWRGGR